MSYGKEIFRGKYKKTMDSLNIIKDNYYDLDQEYQISMKEKDKEIERLNNRLKTSNDTCNYLRNTIDKAMEYMDRRDLEWGSDEHNKMMNILKGEDKE